MLSIAYVTITMRIYSVTSLYVHNATYNNCYCIITLVSRTIDTMGRENYEGKHVYI